MNAKEEVRISRFLSLVLRHHPEHIGIVVDNAGWTDVLNLLQALYAQGTIISMDDLIGFVERNTKRRFAFNEDKTMIRASQGHSINVGLGYPPSIPPEILYHGTGKQYAACILDEGLKKMKRQHVHLSADVTTATAVGRRWGSPVIFQVASGIMHGEGFVFFQSENGVWLTDHVPSKYITCFIQ